MKHNHEISHASVTQIVRTIHCNSKCSLLPVYRHVAFVAYNVNFHIKSSMYGHVTLDLSVSR